MIHLHHGIVSEMWEPQPQILAMMNFKNSVEALPGSTLDWNPLPVQGTQVRSLVWEDSMWLRAAKPVCCSC